MDINEELELIDRLRAELASATKQLVELERKYHLRREDSPWDVVKEKELTPQHEAS
jgi:hypothetical protein